MRATELITLVVLATAAVGLVTAILQLITAALTAADRSAARAGPGNLPGVGKEHHQGDFWTGWLARPDQAQPPDHELHRVEGRGLRTVARCTCGRWWRGWRALQKWRRHYRETR